MLQWSNEALYLISRLRRWSRGEEHWESSLVVRNPGTPMFGIFRVRRAAARIPSLWVIDADVECQSRHFLSVKNQLLSPLSFEQFMWLRIASILHHLSLSRKEITPCHAFFLLEGFYTVANLLQLLFMSFYVFSGMRTEGWELMRKSSSRAAPCSRLFHDHQKMPQGSSL